MRRGRKVSLPGRLGDHAPKHDRDLLRNGLPGRETLRPYVSFGDGSQSWVTIAAKPAM